MAISAPFSAFGEADSHPIAAGLPTLAGLCAAALMAWAACPVPRYHTLHWRDPLLLAIEYVALVCLSSGAATWAAAAFARTLWGVDTRPSPGDMASMAAWFAPAAVYFAERSVGGPLLGAVLAANLTKLAPPSKTKEAVLFSSFAVAVCLQAGVVALATHALAYATILLAGSAIVLARRIGDAVPSGTRKRVVTLPVALVFATGLIAADLTNYLMRVRGGRASQADESSRTPPESAPAESAGDIGDYAGVILWPPALPHTALVSPSRLAGGGVSRSESQAPSSIPFDGVYWFLKFPHRKPPPNSHVSRGSPAEMAFRAADLSPLYMEARQNLGMLMATNCCRNVRVDISNADVYARTVQLELTLVNTARANKLFASLGRAPVTSIPQWRPGKDDEPASESLVFPMPANAPIREFDEIVVRFRLSSIRKHRSARIAIERFVLEP